MAVSEKSVGIVLVVLLVLGSLAIGFGPELMRGSKRKRLLNEGAPATATILSLSETGNRSNDNPEVQIRLRVAPEGKAVYEASVTTYLTAVELQNYVVGAQIAVRYDPEKPAEVALAGQPVLPSKSGP